MNKNPIFHLRTDPAPFQQVWTGKQTFQIRPDNDFGVGDTLVLEETRYPTEDRQTALPDYTGREVHCAVTHIMRGPVYGLMAGWVAMSINVFHRHHNNTR